MVVGYLRRSVPAIVAHEQPAPSVTPVDLDHNGTSGPSRFLDASDADLQVLFRALGDGLGVCETIVDEFGDVVDFRYVWVNPLFEAFTGHVGAAGRTAREFTPELLPVWVQTAARVGLGRETVRFEQQLGGDARNGSYDVLALPLLAPGRFAVVLKDSSRRVAWQDEFDDLPVKVWLHDATGRQQWVNRRFCEFFGVTLDEMRITDWRMPTHPDDGEVYARDLAEAVSDEKPFHGLVRTRRADGQWRWLESWARPHRGAGGAFLGHLGMSMDVTDRGVAEETLRTATALDGFRARLGDAARMAADPVEVQRAAALLGEHLGASRVYYAELDESGQFGTVQTDFHRGVPSVVGRHRFDAHGAVVMSDLRAGRTIVVDDVAHDERLTGIQRSVTTGLDVGAWVMEPLIRSGRTIAALVVHHITAHVWTDDELAVINETMHRTREALAQLRAEQSLRVGHARAEAVARLVVELEAQTSADAWHQMIVEALVPLVADYATIEAPDQSEYLLAATHVDPTQLETLRVLRLKNREDAERQNSTRRVAQGEAQLLAAVAARPVEVVHTNESEAHDRVSGLWPRSSIVAPLDLGGGVKGVLLVGLVDAGRDHFTSDDFEFVQTTALRVGLVLAAARLRQFEHGIALQLQKALLPDTIRWHPDLVIEARYDAASAMLDVGGDWYDTFTWPDGRVGIMVGDVVGHNLASAAAMGRLRAATAALASHLDPDPAQLLDAVDRFAKGPDGTSFATAVCVIVEPSTGQLTYSSAGHPPVLVISPHGVVQHLDGAQSPPLCALIVKARPRATVTLEPGSLVIMYSDGLVERRRERLDDGIARLEHAALGCLDKPIAEIADRLVSDMAAFSPPSDDVVIACFRYTPATAVLNIQFPAKNDELAPLRSQLRVWLHDHGIIGQPVNDVLLVVGEACSNAIEHAYLDDTNGTIDLELANRGSHLVARIVDHGTWRQPGPHNHQRGRGTTIMQGISTHYTRESNTHGTTVTMMILQPIRTDVALA